MGKSLEDKRRKKRRERERQLKRQSALAKTQPAAIKLAPNLERKIIRSHQDVLQNIEFVLSSIAREDPLVDDNLCDRVLHLAAAAESPSDNREQRLLDALAEIRGFRGDISDDVWRNALRVVRASVRRHSSGRPGGKQYLSFVSQFLV